MQQVKTIIGDYFKSEAHKWVYNWTILKLITILMIIALLLLHGLTSHLVYQRIWTHDCNNHVVK